MLVQSTRVSLKRRVLGAGFWSLGGYALRLTISFGTNLVMTRLLAPDMFGVMAVAYVIMAGLAMFSDLGLRAVVIRSSRGQDPVFLNTAWALQILRGLLLWAIAAGIALLMFFAQNA